MRRSYELIIALRMYAFLPYKHFRIIKSFFYNISIAFIELLLLWYIELPTSYVLPGNEFIDPYIKMLLLMLQK